MKDRPAHTYRVQVQSIDLPRRDSLDGAWAFVQTLHNSPAVTRWNDNGMRVGVLPAADVGRFISAIPNPLRVERQAIIAPDGREVALSVAPPLKNNTMIQWSKGRTEQQNITWPMELRRGKPQFLLCVTSAGAGMPQSSRLTLTPHLFYSVPTLVPQTSEEYTRSGRVFEELSLDVILDSGQVLVIAVTSPWADQETDDAEASQPIEEGEESAEQSEEEQAVNASRPLLRLGDVLLAAKAFRVEVQSVVLLGVPYK